MTGKFIFNIILMIQGHFLCQEINLNVKFVLKIYVIGLPPFDLILTFGELRSSTRSYSQFQGQMSQMVLF